MARIILRRRSGFTVFDLIVLVAVSGSLAGLLVPAALSTRQAAARVQSQNNLKQLGIAVNNYTINTQGKIPPSYDDKTKRSLFWSLLPQLEAQNLQTMESTETKAPALKVLEAPLDVSNPGGQGLTSYCSNASVFGGPDGAKAAKPLVNLWAIYNQKGSTNMILFGERYASLNSVWSSPKCYIYGGTKGSQVQFNVTPKTAKDGASPGFCQAFSPTGCNVCMGDGSVYYLKNVGANPTTNFVTACDPTSTATFTSDW